MKKVIHCKKCHSEYCDESFGMNWDNDNSFNLTENEKVDCCPACGCEEFDIIEENICYKNSKCSGWTKSMHQLEDQQVFCHLHYAGPIYKGEKFKYCPWCGEHIETTT